MSEHEEGARRGSAEPVVVVGVLPDQPLWVVQVAAEFARSFGARLVCVTVDTTHYSVQELPDGTLVSAPILPEPAAPEPLFPPERVREIAELLGPLGVEWSLRQLEGEPAAALMAAADELDALMIVVGTRPAGLGGALRTFFTGSVAVRLAHRQYRPVVVVPGEPPPPPGEPLPWEETTATG
jgi:nucleotide-binding universal stress UspA family protein